MGRELTAAANNADRRRGRVVFDDDAQPTEGLHHHLGVFALKRAGQERLALGQRSANQRPVGDALRPRRTDGRPQRPGRSDFNGVEHGHDSNVNGRGLTAPGMTENGPHVPGAVGSRLFFCVSWLNVAH